MLAITICAMGIHAQESGDKQVPEDFRSLLKFEERLIELGDVKKGESRSSKFKFTNVSEEEVTIEFVSVCECTEVDYPTLPILPGESGEIDFTFDSSDKEKSEKIVLDILLTNIEPETGYQVIEQVHYTYELVP